MRPITDDSGRVIEPFDDYFHRFKKRHPHIPKDVVDQWFHYHAKAYGDNEWLGYDSLKFEEHTITVDELKESDFENTAIGTYLHNYSNGKRWPRLDRFLEYFKQHGTWPKPIILFRNPNMKMLERYGIENEMEWMILEGHQRLTAFFIMRREESLDSDHIVWKVTKETV